MIPTICLLLFVSCLLALLRVSLVVRFHSSILAEIMSACHVDICARKEWEWRFNALDACSLNDMALQFWRPLTIAEWYGNDDFVSNRTSR